ncbi:MAG TPA: LuxR C-terminal-related transcriptional regulator [Dehalococcoidia bacterium]
MNELTSESLTLGREAFRQQAWREAYERLLEADRESELTPEDLDALAIAAHLVGQQSECIDFWTRAHHEFLRRGEIERAVRCAFWLGLCLMMQDEPARSSGWLTRGRRLLEEAGLDCVERGYLLMPQALQTYWGGDVRAGHALFQEVVGIGERFREPDLIGIARIGVGETLVHMGEPNKGLALLDETMASLTAGELSPMAVGLVYCALLACCQQIFDMRRAQEWTAAFTRWCESQPDLVPYRGDCRVNRAAIMQLRGAWPNAMEEAQLACEDLGRPGSKSWAGAAFYQQAEVFRLRGEFAKAEAAYRDAHQWGFSPQPGLALLRLAQGRLDLAVAAISQALAEAQDSVARTGILPAHVEIMLAAREIDAARASADELREIAAGRDAPFLKALSATCTGAVLLAEDNATLALSALRQALAAWSALDAPYEAARVRVLLARACGLLGDEDGAALELAAARKVFEELGAAPELARLVGEPGLSAPAARGGLSTREVEVLRLIATGKTNRAIAEELYLSEKTVARHVSNIFAKLSLSSRAAATAYAYENGLL